MHVIILRETVCSVSTSEEMIQISIQQSEILLENN